MFLSFFPEPLNHFADSISSYIIEIKSFVFLFAVPTDSVKASGSVSEFAGTGKWRRESVFGTSIMSGLTVWCPMRRVLCSFSSSVPGRAFLATERGVRKNLIPEKIDWVRQQATQSFFYTINTRLLYVGIYVSHCTL